MAGGPHSGKSCSAKWKGKENKSPKDAAAGEEASEHKKKKEPRRGGAGPKRERQSARRNAEEAAAAAENSAPAPAVDTPPAEEAAEIGEQAPPGKKWVEKPRQRGGIRELQKKRAPSFSEDASGRPADWNSLSTTLYWGKKTENHFQASATASEVDVQSLCAFLQKRKDGEGKPVIKLFDEPVPQEDGWFRLRRRDCSDEEVEALEEKGWERAWHGCKLEALYSIIINGLSESRDPERGERMLAGAPGVYLHKDGTMHKAEHYIRFVPLCGDGVFWAAKWEARVDRADRVKVPRQTDQWVQRKRSVRLVALWVCGRTAADMHPGDAVSPAWDPLQEAHPFKQQEPREPEPAEQGEEEGDESSSPSRTPQERLALAGSPGWLEVRSQDGWEELWCHLCRKWGDQAHMASARHKDRALRPHEYWSAAPAAAAPALCDAAVSSTAAASPPEEPWSAACGTAEEDPHKRWLRCQGYLLRRWMGSQGWEDDFCLLCRKWAAETHFESKRHKWNAESPKECVDPATLREQRGWDGDRSESSAEECFPSGEEDLEASGSSQGCAAPAGASAKRHSPSVATWCLPLLPRPERGPLSELIEV